MSVFYSFAVRFVANFGYMENISNLNIMQGGMEKTDIAAQILADRDRKITIKKVRTKANAQTNCWPHNLPNSNVRTNIITP